MRTATENLLADFLREMRDIAIVQKRSEEKARHVREVEAYEQARKADDSLPDITMTHPERAAFLPEGESNTGETVVEQDAKDIGSKYFLHKRWVCPNVGESPCPWSRREGGPWSNRGDPFAAIG